MAMSKSLQDFLETKGVEFELIEHPHTASSTETAEAAHVPGDLLAKTVVVENGDSYVGVVIPSTKHVNLAAVCERLGQQCGLTTEQRIETLFEDCEVGAIPAVPQAYGLGVLLDESLKDLDEVYFEAGDHTHLAHVSGEAFAMLMSGATEGDFMETWT